MANPYGPTRGELKFRAAVSVVGLAFLGLAIALRGLPEGPAFRHLIAGDLDALAGLPSFERLTLETPR